MAKPPNEVQLQPRLRARALTKADRGFLTIVEFGPEPWSLEVERHLRKNAESYEARGICSTTLFSRPDEEQIVGFYSTRTHRLTADAEFLKRFEISNRQAPFDAFDACYLTAFGVDIKFQRQGYSPEIHLALIQSLVSGAVRPFFVFLKVWADNPAVGLYERWRYRRIGDEVAHRKEDGTECQRLLMALKIRP
jgi:ribosomal protein S18 acetylase RimI-like enzyme